MKGLHVELSKVKDKRTARTNVNTTLTKCPVGTNLFTIPDRPGGGTPLYKVYRYVPPLRVWFLSRFGLKKGIDFDNYGLKSGRVFGAGNIYESLQTYFSSQYVTGTTN